jgi:multiple sugar transport system permease protein
VARLKGLREWSNDLEKFPTIMMIPISIMLNLIAIFPLFILAYASVTNWSPSTGDWFRADLIWTGNWIRMAEDSIFLNSIGRTVGIVAAATTLEFVFGLILALLFVDQFRGRRILISVFLTPMMVIPAVSGYMFFMMFQGTGPINKIISIVSGTPLTIGWLSVPKYAIMSVILMDVWQWTPFMFLILLSGMLSLPPSYKRRKSIGGVTIYDI